MLPKQEYRQIKVPPELHKRLKTLAVKKQVTVIQLLEELLKQKLF